MTTVVLLAHAPLASALRGCGGHCFEEAAGHLRSLDIPPTDDPDTVSLRLRSLLADLGPEEPVLVLADVPGATPYNGAKLAAAHDARLHVLAGLNVPMLWRTLCYLQQRPVDELVRLAAEGGIEGIRSSLEDPSP